MRIHLFIWVFYIDPHKTPKKNTLIFFVPKKYL
jgi:hypothetical protein